jgi:outer membrane protein OmpA-like peptidoglycan-associated protein/tetratricopeptide (TPR) repeat protein
MKHAIAIFFFSLVSISIFAQKPYKTTSVKAIRFYEEGLNNYNGKNYPFAEEYLLDAIKIDEKFQNAYLVLAEVYWEQGKYLPAIQYYNMGLQLDPSFYPLGYVNKGNLEIKIASYEEALKSFQKYLELDTSVNKHTEQAKRGIKQAGFAIWAMKHPVDFEPVNLGPNINTRDDEYWPSLSADEQTLVFTRLVHYDMNNQHVQEDFYFSTKTESGWSLAKSAGYPLNTPDNEGAQSISANGKFMVYTVCNREGVIGRCDLYYSTKKGNDWTFPKNMGEPINTVYKETQPSLSADGRTIYFASDRPGGKGMLDIWMSRQNENGSWQNPVNLGDSINTPGDEMSPFIHQDGKTLYFSSNTLIGMGGFDIFIARRNEKGNWKHVENLGYPINTNGDEVGLIVNAQGDKAYFSSNRNKEYGKDLFEFNLYKKARPEEVSYMKGVVYDKITRSRLEARFELYDLKNGNLVNESSSDPETGEFLLCIPTNRNYMLNVERSGYLFFSDNFSLQGIFHIDTPFLMDVPMKPIVSGEKIVLYNVFYETDSYQLKPESQYELDKVLQFLNANPDIHIEIGGHTDNIGSEAHNQTLSENRARSVVSYLTEHGINAERLRSKGYGFSVPIETNDSNEGRAKNRRTELMVVN